MTSNDRSRRFPRMLAGTVLAGTLAFAAQASAQQAGTTQGTRPDRGAEQRGPGGRGGRGGPEQMVERRVSMLTERLGLSATQAVSIREILIDEQTRMEALRPQRTGPESASRAQRTRGDSASRASRARPDSAQVAEVRARMNEIHTQTDARIESVLTPAQRSTYGELVAARAERGEGAFGRGPGGRGGRGGPGKGAGARRTPPPAAV